MTPDINGMLKVPVTHRMLLRAKEKMDSITTDGKLNSKTFNLKNKIAGFIGEQCLASVYPDATNVDTKTHDFLLFGQKIDVKTKFRKVPPKLYFNGAIPSYQMRTNIDSYAFFSVYEHDGNYICIMCGRIYKDEFKKKARLIRKGETDGGRNEIKFIEDAYIIKYSDLKRW